MIEIERTFHRRDGSILFHETLTIDECFDDFDDDYDGPDPGEKEPKVLDNVIDITSRRTA